MNSLNETNLQQIITQVQPRTHENMIHLVSKLFHKLMLRSVDLQICVVPHMDKEVRETYVTDIAMKLASVSKIHMLHLYSQWATTTEANCVLMRLAFPVLDVSPMAVGEGINVTLETLQLELNNATCLPENVWKLTTLGNLDIENSMRITSIPACMISLCNLTFLHIDNCTRLAVIKMVPPNLHTLRITSCPMLAIAPHNLQEVLTLTTLELEELALKTLPNLRMLWNMTFLRVADCKNLVRIGRLPDSLETLVISKCDVLAAMPANMQLLFDLKALQVNALPRVTNLGVLSLFAELRILSIQKCRRLNLPASLPLSLVFFRYSCCDDVPQHWPNNLHLLTELQTFDVSVTHRIPPDLGRLPKLTKIVLNNYTQFDGLAAIRLPMSLENLHIERHAKQGGHVFGRLPPLNLGELSHVTQLHIAHIRLSHANFLQIQACAALCRGRDGVGFTHLSLVDCDIRMAPEWISENTGLEHLDLSRNSIKKFPEEYERLTNLHTLSIGNDIESGGSQESTTIPSFIYTLPRLECLNIGGFFQDAPLLGLGDPHFLAICNMQLARLTHLTSLDISGNRFRVVRCCFPLPCSLSVVFYVCSYVFARHCFDYVLTQVPDGMHLLTNLEFLDLSSNGFQRVDVDFSGMERLRTLKIKDELRNEEEGNLTSIVLSETISTLYNLTMLDLRDTDLVALPHEIGRLQNLETLNIDGCMLNELPASITKLVNLKTLHAQNNCLSEIVQDIGKMQSLTDLDLFNNDFTTVPDSICTLPQLRRLFLKPEHDLTCPVGFDMFIASSNVKYNVEDDAGSS